jgi:hypothetical protein
MGSCLTVRDQEEERCFRISVRSGEFEHIDERDRFRFDVWFVRIRICGRI